MYLLDDIGSILEAEFSLDRLGGEPCVVLESSGGGKPSEGVARRNPYYNRVLELLLERLGRAGAKATRFALIPKSGAAKSKSLADRTAELNQRYPIDLGAQDISSFRKHLGHTIANLQRDPASDKSGMWQRRIGICLDRDVAPSLLMYRAGGKPVDAVDTVDFAPKMNPTEKERLTKARIGQGRFRDQLLADFDGKCPLTGVENPLLLTASHIKPWSVSANFERLDRYNGLLLSATADRMFDNGLITFDDYGLLFKSSSLTFSALISAGIAPTSRIRLKGERSQYMRYHRANKFEGQL